MASTIGEVPLNVLPALYRTAMDYDAEVKAKKSEARLASGVKRAKKGERLRDREPWR